ncbi:hypothetical protein Trydic_g2282 [Trypoxylus dichotomus]
MDPYPVVARVSPTPTDAFPLFCDQGATLSRIFYSQNYSACADVKGWQKLGKAEIGSGLGCLRCGKGPEATV